MKTSYMLFDENILELRNSKEFMKDMLDNIPSAIFILNKNLEVQAFNKSMEAIFPYLAEKKTLNNLVGNTIGCINPIEEGKRCGDTSKCEGCLLRIASIYSLKEKKSFNNQKIIKEFYINDIKKVRKHLEFSTRFLYHNKNDILILILNDVSEITEQKLKIAEQKEQIDASIRYARDIQKAVLPNKKSLHSDLFSKFIINMPKDVIGGDFYWFKQKNNKLYLAVADCTGHGVPGALLSILGISIINSFENALYEHTTGEFLKLLKNKIRAYLQTDDEESKLNDGMDISYCIIDFENKKLQFSGANNSLYLVRDKNIYTFLGNKMPIDLSSENFTFETFETNIRQGDSVYLSTDGYKDQFGGPNNKKIGTNFFKEILTEISNKPMPEQETLLHETFLTWKDKFQQTDDICIVGIKVN